MDGARSPRHEEGKETAQKDKNKAEKGMKQTPNGVSAVDAENRLRVTLPLADGAFLGLLSGTSSWLWGPSSLIALLGLLAHVLGRWDTA